MIDAPTARHAIARDISTARALLSELPAGSWSQPTRLEGWSVADLAAHLAWGQGLQADAWSHVLDGSDAIAQSPEVETTEPGPLLEALDTNHTALLRALDRVEAEHLGRPCAMPYGTLPAAVVLQVAAFEAGVHGHDVASALGGPDVPLADDVLTAAAVLLPTMLAMGGAASSERPPAGTTVAVDLGPHGTTVLRATGTAWEAADGGEVTVRIAGEPSAVLLFATGRVGPSAVEVSGRPELATSFKRWFPGP